jgi:hypothetical protein
MIELYLSSDGKHTVHVSSETAEGMANLVLEAKALYAEVVEQFGAKLPPAEHATNGQSNGHAPIGRRIDTVAQAREAVTPRCPRHGVPMAYRQGRRGPFWSCPTREPDGEWCRVTREAYQAGNGHPVGA